MSFILPFLHSLLCTVNGPYSQAVTKLLCCIILFDFGLQFAVFGGGGAPHAPLSPVAVTLGALGLCFIVLIFKNKSVVCVICFPDFLFHLAHHDTRLVLINLILKFFDVKFKYHLHEICILRFFFKGWIFLVLK